MFDILRACHDVPCGGHFVNKRIAYRVLQQGYYWPMLLKDVRNYVRSCNNCQRMGRLVQAGEMPLQPQVLVEPFERWALLPTILWVVSLGEKNSKMVLSRQPAATN